MAKAGYPTETVAVEVENVDVSDPRNVGDKAPGSSCALYSLLGALHPQLDCIPEVRLCSVQDMAEALITHNLKNAQGRAILQHGVTIEFLSDTLNEKMQGFEPSLIFRTACQALMKFRIAYRRYDGIDQLRGDMRDTSHGIVIAKKLTGNHG